MDGFIKEGLAPTKFTTVPWSPGPGRGDIPLSANQSLKQSNKLVPPTRMEKQDNRMYCKRPFDQVAFQLPVFLAAIAFLTAIVLLELSYNRARKQGR